MSVFIKKLFKKRSFSQYCAIIFKIFPIISHITPDSICLKLIFRSTYKKKLDLTNPKTFNEKIQWLKLYNRCPEYTMMADKYAVREYIAKTIGAEYLVPAVGVWDKPNDINFDELPNKFVLKCNHNSGIGLCICSDKSSLDIEKTKKELKKGLQQNHYLWGKEWVYKNIKRRIVGEALLENDDSSEVINYRLMCFNGKVLCIHTTSSQYYTYFDINWQKLPFTKGLPPSQENIPKPINFAKMITLAEKLATNIPFVRVDLYEVNGKIFFGELTFYPSSGYTGFTPDKWDYILGSWLILPK